GLIQRRKEVTATSSEISPGVLGPFVGEWKIRAAFESMTPSDIGGRVRFEWPPDNRVLIERWEISVSRHRSRRGRAMGKLIYSAIASLDGYIEDEDGKFDWGEPDEEVHTFVNDLLLPVGTYLYGRRMYETMVAWETIGLADDPPFIQHFAEIWGAAEKIVYSKTPEAVSSARTRVERDFDPEAVRQLKTAAKSDLTVGGPHL